MLIVPGDKLKEWEDHYHKSHLDKQVSLQLFIAQCAAVWGYDQGLEAFGHLFNIDPEWF